jgi:hypothetical protein
MVMIAMTPMKKMKKRRTTTMLKVMVMVMVRGQRTSGPLVLHRKMLATTHTTHTTHTTVPSMRARFRLGSFCGLAGGAAVAAVVVVVVAVAAGAAAAAGFFLGRPAFFRSTSTHWSAFPISTHFLHGRPLCQKYFD